MNELCAENALIQLPGYYTVDTVLKTKMKNVEINLGGAISYTPHIAYWNASSIYLTYVSRNMSSGERRMARDPDTGSALIRVAKRDYVLVL